MKSIVRSMQIIIDKLSLGAEPWVALHLQTYQLNENQECMTVSARTDQIHKKGSKIYAEEVSITNPFTNEVKVLTGLEVQLAIAAFSRKWIMEDAISKGKKAYLSSVNSSGRAYVVVEDN